MNPLIGLLLVAPSLAMAALKPQLHNGLYFKPLERVLASSAQLVIIPFDTSIPDLQTTLHNLTDTLEAKLNKLSPSQKNVSEAVIADLKKMHARLNLHFADVRRTARRNAHREKRSANPLSSISSLLGWCCGFSTAEDVRVLGVRDEELWKKLIENEDRFHNAFYQNNKYQHKLAEELNKWKGHVEWNQHDLKQNLTQGLAYASQVDMIAALVNSLAFDMLLVLDRIKSIEAACVANRIPSTVVTQKDLEGIVKKVNYRNQGHRVAVEDMDALYKLEIASCHFRSEDELLVLAKFPLEPTPGGSPRWTMFDVTPMAFLSEGQVCQLLKRPVVAVVAPSNETKKSTVVRLMEGEHRTACLLRSLCNVPRITEAEDLSCVNGVHTKAEMQELKKVCNFTCRPYRRLQIVHIGHNNYSVVNADRDLVVRCTGDAEVKDVPRETVGALLLEVPCDCTLEDKVTGAVLIERQKPCDNSYSLAINFTLGVPQLWVVDDYARLMENMTEVPTEEFKSTFLNFTPPSSKWTARTASASRTPPSSSSGGFWGRLLEQWWPIALVQLPSLALLAVMFHKLQGQNLRLRKLGV